MLTAGCEPAALEPSRDVKLGLSAPVEAAVEEAIRAVEVIIARVSENAAAA